MHYSTLTVLLSVAVIAGIYLALLRTERKPAKPSTDDYEPLEDQLN